MCWIKDNPTGFLNNDLAYKWRIMKFFKFCYSSMFVNSISEFVISSESMNSMSSRAACDCMHTVLKQVVWIKSVHPGKVICNP